MLVAAALPSQVLSSAATVALREEGPRESYSTLQHRLDRILVPSGIFPAGRTLVGLSLC